MYLSSSPKSLRQCPSIFLSPVSSVHPVAFPPRQRTPPAPHHSQNPTPPSSSPLPGGSRPRSPWLRHLPPLPPSPAASRAKPYPGTPPIPTQTLAGLLHLARPRTSSSAQPLTATSMSSRVRGVRPLIRFSPFPVLISDLIRFRVCNPYLQRW